MLAFIDGQLVEVTPIPVLVNNFDLSPRDSRLTLFADGKPVESGVDFYSMDRNGQIHPRSGEFSVKQGRKARFRAVFAGKSQDIVLC